MQEEFERSQLLLGKKSIESLANKKVIIFGVGGVGSYVSEGLARTGIGNFTLVDNDVVCKSNINRQIVALHSTIGKYKVDVMKNRIKDINPLAEVETIKEFYLPNQSNINLEEYDYVIDAIDTVSAKLDIATICYNKKIPLISAMGCGNKLDPTKLQFADIYETHTCRLAKVMRYELKKRNVKKLNVVYSTEKVVKREELDNITSNKRQTPGSVSFVPSVAGLMIAGKVIMDLTYGLRP